MSGLQKITINNGAFKDSVGIGDDLTGQLIDIVGKIINNVKGSDKSPKDSHYIMGDNFVLAIGDMNPNVVEMQAAQRKRSVN